MPQPRWGLEGQFWSRHFNARLGGCEWQLDAKISKSGHFSLQWLFCEICFFLGIGGGGRTGSVCWYKGGHSTYTKKQVPKTEGVVTRLGHKWRFMTADFYFYSPDWIPCPRTVQDSVERSEAGYHCDGNCWLSRTAPRLVPSPGSAVGQICFWMILLDFLYLSALKLLFYPRDTATCHHWNTSDWDLV